MSGEKYLAWENALVREAVKAGKQPHHIWPKLPGRTFFSVERKFIRERARLRLQPDMDETQTKNMREDDKFCNAMAQAMRLGLEQMPVVDRDCQRDDFRPVRYQPEPTMSLYGSQAMMCAMQSDPLA